MTKMIAKVNRKTNDRREEVAQRARNPAMLFARSTEAPDGLWPQIFSDEGHDEGFAGRRGLWSGSERVDQF
jgi:hypothetical protein